MTITLEFKKRAFGTGYNSFSFEETGNSALTDASTADANVISTPQNSGIFDIEVAKSVTELTRQVTAKVSAEGALLGAEVDGSAEFFRRTTLTVNQTYIVATVRVTTEIQALRDRKQIDDGAATRDPRDFFEKFGDFYVNEVHLGGSLTLIVTVDLADQSAKQTFDASLNVKGGPFTGAGASSRFATELQNATKNESIRIFVSHVGGDSLPAEAADDLGSALKYALGFEDTVRARPVVYEAVFADYSALPNAPKGLEKFLAEPRRRQAALAEAVQQYLPLQGAVDTAREDADLYDLNLQERNTLQKIQRSIAADIETIRMAARRDNINKIPNKVNVSRSPEAYTKEIDAFNLNARLRVTFGALLALAGNEQFISGAINSGDNDFPTYGDGRIGLRFPGTGGVIHDGMTVFVETNEARLAKTPRLAASSNHADLVYRDRNFEAEKQSWRLRKVQAGDRIVRYGDKVTLENISFSPQVLAPRDDKEDGRFFLTTRAPGSQGPFVWTIKRK